MRCGTRAGCNSRHRCAERGCRIMAQETVATTEHERPKAPLIYNPKVRGLAYQAVLCAVIVFLAWSAIHNAAENLTRAKIASGFGFWDNTAGFDISQSLIDYQATSSYGRAFWV